MSGARYVGGWIGAAGLLVPLWFAACLVRRRWFAGLTGSVARLAESVLVVATLLGLAQLLGSVGAFALIPLVVSSLVVCGLCVFFVRGVKGAGRDGNVVRPVAVRRAEVVLAAAAIGMACIPFVSATLRGLRHGVSEYDSNWYHLPVAAGFVQQGWTTRLHFTGSVPTTYFPANSELLHAVGMLLSGTDIVSPVLNLGWLALAFLAAWCIGRRVGHPGLVVLAVSVVLSLPVVAYSQGGTADADLPGIAMLLATMAFLSCADSEGPGIRLFLLAAASAGVLVGIKLTYLPVVLVLVVVVLITVPVVRRRAYVITGFTTLFVTGSFWYLRNLARTGSPLPSAPLRVSGIGFARIADAASDCGTRSVAGYATNVGVWRSAFAPMLRLWFGPLWWVVGLGTGLALVAALVRRHNALSRTIAITGVVAAITYVVTPASAGGPAGDPVCFGYNTRFLVPTMALGAIAVGVVLATVLGVRSSKAYWASVVVLFAVMLVTLWSSMRLTPGLEWRGYALAVVLIGSTGVTGFVLYRWTQRQVPREATAVVVVLAVAALGWIPARVWRIQRSTTWELAFLGSLRTWADSSPKMRIAIVGFSEQWPLYGAHLQNHVGLPEVESERGALRSPSDCDGWRRALRAGRFDHIVIASQDGSDVGPVLPWIAGDAAARRINIPRTAATVFRFDPTAPVDPCKPT